ncbi:MAG: hypothetical protein GX791_07085, partial [Synergistaceae bacterium]|nr:hypothetical protein [Synergistaceae bacterium]
MALKRMSLRGAGLLPHICFLLFALLLYSSTAGASGDISIEIPSSVTVSASPFTLFEIASLSGDPAGVQRAGALFLTLPEKGFITREEIVEAMMKAGIGGLTI